MYAFNFKRYYQINFQNCATIQVPANKLWACVSLYLCHFQFFDIRMGEMITRWQFKLSPSFIMGFPGGSDGKESACSTGDHGSIPGLGRTPGEGNGNPLQYSCLEDPMDRGAWWAKVHGVSKSWTQLSD